MPQPKAKRPDAPRLLDIIEQAKIIQIFKTEFPDKIEYIPQEED